MQELAEPLRAILQTTIVMNNSTLRASILAAVCDPDHRSRTLLLGVTEASAHMPAAELEELGITAIANLCEQSLIAELQMPERDSSDWSIVGFESSDGCKDCTQLADFLADSGRKQFVWPLAKPRRQHIHQWIDLAELPLTHVTKREGSPHKLVITKNRELFDREARHRSMLQASLESVQQLISSGASSTPARPRPASPS